MEQTFLDTLKARQQEAHKRLQETQQRLQQAQQEFQIASQEAGSWNIAVMAETKRIELARVVTVVVPAPKENVVQIAHSPLESTALTATKPETNKTEIVRSFLQQRANGATPGDIWESLKSQMDRPYIYSVLKRLKDKDEIQERRGKYYFKHRPQAGEGQHTNTTVQ